MTFVMALRINFQKLRPGYLLKRRGKNSKIAYIAGCICRGMTPSFYLKHRLRTLLDSLDKRQDQNLILDRVDYYNKLQKVTDISKSKTLADIPNRDNNYNRDFFAISRFFNRNLFVDTAFGDNVSIADTPSIVKSRPINGDIENDVVLNLDKVRHFIFLNDKLNFSSKINRAIFRGAAYHKHRRRFLEMYFNHPLVDCGDTSKASGMPAEWKKPLITLYDHLKYKFVICLEGNDVASNLKWVMSSNSLAVMPKPKYETWFMEGRLQPNVHYVEIREDYSDLEEKIRYYSEHIEEAEAILKNAHDYVAQFQDKDREELISILVLKKYF